MWLCDVHEEILVVSVFGLADRRYPYFRMATSEGQLSFYYTSFNPTVCQSCAYILSKPVLICYHLFGMLSANVIDTSPWEKSQSGDFSVNPTGRHSVNSILRCFASLSVGSMERVFSRWGWGDSGHGSNGRSGIPQHRVNNFSNFRYAENPKQRDKIDNWSVILWN